MQNIIQLLPDHVANQIAAGEVVQRPSSVIKELLENAVDAGATRIEVHLKEAGRNLIQVIDNGKGMSMTDARMAFERHATSKINTTEDLFQIKTKGFRGEALASIAAVAQVELKTKLQEDEMGTQLIIEGSEIKNHSPILTSDGSIFNVKNLFYNVPARRKFLKSNNVELRHINDEFIRVALTHPEIEFVLSHNEKEMYNLKAANQSQRIVALFGKKMQANLVPIDIELDWIQIKGFIGKPESAKKRRGEQFFFVNDRYFRSPYFNKAVADAYDGLLNAGYFPSFYIYIKIDSDAIDVNIHPSKTEIKFENESDIYALLLSSIKQSIGIYNVAPSLDFEQQPEWQGSLSTHKNVTIRPPKVQVDPNYNPFHNLPSSPQISSVEKTAIEELYSAPILSDNLPQEELLFESSMPMLRLSNGSWIVEKTDSLWIIDPHRIHQTLIFHKVPKSLERPQLSQQLLFPIEYPIDTQQKIQLESIENDLADLGFETDYTTEFLSINALPSDMDPSHVIPLFESIWGELEEHNNGQFLAFFAEKVSIVAAKNKSQWQSEKEIGELLQQFEEIGNPLYSPFKKKNYIKLPLQELENKLQI